MISHAEAARSRLDTKRTRFVGANNCQDSNMDLMEICKMVRASWSQSMPCVMCVCVDANAVDSCAAGMQQDARWYW